MYFIYNLVTVLYYELSFVKCSSEVTNKLEYIVAIVLCRYKHSNKLWKTHIGVKPITHSHSTIATNTELSY